MNQLFHNLYFWLFLLVVAMVAVKLVVGRIRYSYQNYDPRSNDWDLADLQKLVANGQMTAEEYEKAKAVILSRSDSQFQPAKGFPVLGPPEKPKDSET